MIGDKRRKWVRMGLRDLVYRVYERRLETSLSRYPVPRHVGVILDGNRRWARLAGFADVSDGHQKGAEHIVEMLGWCSQAGVEVVTLWLLSTDNLARPASELEPLLKIIESTVQRPGRRGLAREAGGRARSAARGDGPGAQGRRRSHRAAARACWSTWPSATAAAGRSPTRSGRCCRTTRPRAPRSRNWPRSSTWSTSPSICIPPGQPDPDLVIRTSGEQRLGGFLLWQSAHSEFYFCDAYWPDFRRVDFLRALRSYSARQRRFGS